MRIGELARMAGASVQTLRFHERRGLVPSPRREGSGYRVYPAETVMWIATLLLPCLVGSWAK